MVTHVCKELHIKDTVIKEPMSITLQGERLPETFIPRAKLAWRILLGATDTILAVRAVVMNCHFNVRKEDTALSIK